MRAFLAVILFLAVCAILAPLATTQQGVPVTGLLDSTALDARRATLEARSTLAAGEAAYIRAAQDSTRQAFAQQLAAQTAEARAQTAVVVQQQTRAAWQVTVAAGQAQGTATAHAAATAAQGTAAAISIQATGDAAGVAAFATQQYQQAQINSLKVIQEEIKTDVYSTTRYWWVFVTVFLAICGVLAGAWLLKMRDDVNIKTIPRGFTGEIEGVWAKGKGTNLDRTIVPVVDPRHPVTANTPEQMQITMLDQGVQGIGRLNKAGYPRSARQAAEQIAERVSRPVTQPLVQPGDQTLPVSVPWSIMDSWPGGKLTLGQGAGGHMIMLDPDEDTAPHLLMAGTTNAGKTHYGLHPIVTQTLADRWQVIILDRSGSGFRMFESHANARLVLLDEPRQAIGYLAAAYQEIIRRQREMAKTGAWKWSLWKGAPSPRTLIVVDEFSNLADDMTTNQERELLWRRARMIASEGRKTGILLAIALQDPSYKAIDLRIRRNCTRVAYQVQDSAASRLILGIDGAEKLEKRHFMTAIGAAVREGVAFDASEEEIKRFLAGRPVAQLPDPAWLHAPVEEDTHQPAEDSRDQRIRDLAAEGKSLNEIQREVFGFTGGAAYSAVKAVLGDSPSTTTTDTASTTAPAPAV